MAIVTSPRHAMLLSHSNEATYGATYESTVTNLIGFPHEQGLILERSWAVRYRNDNEAKSAEQATVDDGKRLHLTGSMNAPLSPSLAGMAAGCMATSIATSNPEAGVTLHRCEWGSTASPSANWKTLVTNHFGSIQDYKGVSLTGFGIDYDRGNALINANVDIMGYNAVQASSFTNAQIALQLVEGNSASNQLQQYFPIKDMKFQRGTYSFATGAFTGVETDQHTKLQSGAFKIAAQVDENAKFQFGSDNTTVDNIQFLGYDVTLSATFELDAIGDGWFDEMIADTGHAIELQIQGANIPTKSTPYEVTVILPKVKAVETTGQDDANKGTRSVTFNSMSDISDLANGDEYLVMNVYSLVADYAS